MATQTNWRDEPDLTYCVRAEFGGGETAYTTLEHAADVLAFIDRAKGINDLSAGMTFRSHVGTMFTIVGIPVEAEAGSFASQLLGLG